MDWYKLYQGWVISKYKNIKIIILSLYHKLILLPNDLVDHCVDAELCKNGGICSNDGSDRGYECLCLPGFYGDNCEIRKYDSESDIGQ